MNKIPWPRITWALWVILIFTLPFTTFPLVMKLTGTSSVAPASLLPMIPLVIIVLPGLIIRRIVLPIHVKTVLLFFLFALLTILMAFLRPIPDYKQQSFTGAALEGTVTLIVGLFFYLAAVSIPNTNEKINRSLRLVNWTGLAIISWSILQVSLRVVFPGVSQSLIQIQELFSPTRLLANRMVGFASEPSWLAHMLNLVFLAYWLAATYTGNSAHTFRIWKFSIENILLGLGIIVLVGTLSRGGLVSFFLVLGLVFVLLNVRLISWIVTKVPGRKKVLLTAVISLGLLVAYLSLILAGLWGLSKVDPRMEKVFVFSKNEPNPIVQYAEDLQFGERVIYWQTGWNIFNDHTISGVGVGFSGFYFPQYLPDAGWGLTETRRLLYRNEGLLNIKNLWVRLLAETGIVGFALFTGFLVIFGITSLDMLRNGKGMRKTLGYMGIFTLTALIFEEFSVDSFALPYLWFSMGLVTAAWRWYTPAIGVMNG